MTIAPTAPTLTDELAAINDRRQRWHAWASGPRSLWAARSHTRAEMAAAEECLGMRPAPSGVTLYGETPLVLDMAIGAWERTNGLAAYEGTCDHQGCTHDRGSHWDGTDACGFCGCGGWATGGEA